MQDVMMKNQLDDWIKIHKNPDDCEALLKKVLSEYTAVTDNPGCGFFLELLKLNPKAKVILTVRDTPEAWVKSANESILRIIYESFFSNTIMNMLVSWMPFVGRPAKLKILGKLSMDRCSVQGENSNLVVV